MVKRKKKAVKREKTLPTISACLILKNEGKTIYRCLDSMKGFVDEYIIGIDNDSEDNTHKEIYRFLDDNNIDDKKIQMYGYTWQDDFSKARNEGMDKATGDYILIMDGHEYFPEQWHNITENRISFVKQYLTNVKKKLGEEELDEIFFQLYQQPFLGQTPNNFFLQPRIYRNDPKIRFNRSAHNTITNTDPKKSIHFVDIILIHDAPEDNRADRKEQRVVMNTAEIERAIKENPKDTRSYFYLGNTLIEAKKYKKAIKCYEKYLKYRKDDTHEKYQVYIHMAICYRHLENYDKARDCLFLAKGIDPMRRDAYSLLGDLFIKTEKYNEAIFELTTMLNVRTRSSRMFQNGATQTWDPHQKLAMAYEKVGNIPKALVHLEHAYRILPNEQWWETIQKWRGGKQNILVIDAQGSFTGDFVDSLKDNKAYSVVKTNKYDLRLCKWADYIWCEWADENAVRCSQQFGNKTVVRLHGYEAYLLDGLHKQMNWKALKKVVFVATHIKDMMVKKGVPEEKAVVIHNGVNVDKFYIKNRKRKGNKVGYAGFINEKKNPFLLIQTIKNNPDIEFHLRVDFQSPFWKATFDYELKDCKNVRYHGRYNDLNDFWNKMDFVISTSIIESFSYNLAEAMACGCSPIVYNWNGANEFWSDYIHDNFLELDPDCIGWTSHDKHRQYIIDNFNYKDKIKDMQEVLLNESI